MKFTQEQMERAAEKWEAMYQALKCIEAGCETVTEAHVMMKMAYPNMTREEAMAHLVMMNRNGYVEGVRTFEGAILLPLKVKITEKGHAYFKEMIEGAKKMAVELGEKEAV